MDDPARSKLYAQSFLERQVDGVIFVSSGSDVAVIDMLTAAEVPVITIDREVSASNVSSVRVDNRRGGYLATRHLIGHGHRRIACLVGPPRSETP